MDDVEVALVSQPFVEVAYPYWPVNSYHVLIPLKFAKHFEEFTKYVNFIIERGIATGFRETVENKYQESVESVGGQTGDLRAQQRGLVSEVGLEQEYASLEQMVVSDYTIIQVIDEVQCAQSPMLVN